MFTISTHHNAMLDVTDLARALEGEGLFDLVEGLQLSPNKKTIDILTSSADLRTRLLHMGLTYQETKLTFYSNTVKKVIVMNYPMDGDIDFLRDTLAEYGTVTSIKFSYAKLLGRSITNGNRLVIMEDITTPIPMKLVMGDRVIFFRYPGQPDRLPNNRRWENPPRIDAPKAPREQPKKPERTPPPKPTAPPPKQPQSEVVPEPIVIPETQTTGAELIETVWGDKVEINNTKPNEKTNERRRSIKPRQCKGKDKTPPPEEIVTPANTENDVTQEDSPPPTQPSQTLLPTPQQAISPTQDEKKTNARNRIWNIVTREAFESRYIDIASFKGAPRGLINETITTCLLAKFGKYVDILGIDREVRLLWRKRQDLNPKELTTLRNKVLDRLHAYATKHKLQL